MEFCVRPPPRGRDRNSTAEPLRMRREFQFARSTGSPSTRQIVGRVVVFQPVRRREAGDRLIAARQSAREFDPGSAMCSTGR